MSLQLRVKSMSMARFRKRVTGVSGGTALGSVGAQWDYIASDKQLAIRVFKELEDRRILYQGPHREDIHECRASAGSLRAFLGSIRKIDHIGSGLDRELRAMQKAAADFQTQIGHLRSGTISSRDIIVPLTILRNTCGIVIGDLAAQYHLDVPDELAAIVPDGNEWFFERFS